MCSLRQNHSWFQVYAVPEEEDILLFSFDFLNPQSLLIGSNDGHVSVVDTRAARKDIAKWIPFSSWYFHMLLIVLIIHLDIFTYITSFKSWKFGICARYFAESENRN